MKICFSTLGCPDWKINEAYAAAKDLKINGIEIRRLENVGYAPKMKSFSEEKLDDTVKMLKDGGVEIPLLASHIVFGKSELREAALCEMQDYAVLAKKLGTKYIKISLNKEPDDFSIDKDAALETVRTLCKIAKQSGVSLLVMTNAAFSDTLVLERFIKTAECDNLFALWDVNYTYRFANEEPSTSMDNLGKLIKLVHLKDSFGENKQILFRPLGAGDVPIKKTLELLSKSGYDGYISVEWKKSWGEEFSSPGIVLSHYVNYIERLLNK